MSQAQQADKQDGLPPLGFIGVGTMGGRMARNLVRAGYSVTVFDVDPERRDACASVGAVAAGSAADAVSAGEFVLTSLPSSAVWVEVAETDLLPNARAGQVFMDMGTTEAAETRRVAAEFTRKGVSLLDCPVSGGASDGTSHIFVGGERAVAERCWPIIEVLGHPDHIAYCGPSGCGQIVKGVNQIAMALERAAYLEALAFGVRGGVEAEVIGKVVGGPEGWRRALAEVAELVKEGKAETVSVKFPELPYFLREAREQGFSIPLVEALFEFCDPGPRNWRDNMGRPEVSFWHMLTKASRRPSPGRPE